MTSGKQVASLIAKIGADISGFDKGAAGVKSGLLGMAKKFISTATVAAAFGKALQFSIDSAAEAQAVDAKLAAVLQSTGFAAGMTADQLDSMATSLSLVTAYDDEAIKSAEALLLTFTKVGSEVFPEATQAILDMSTALGQDLQSSTIQLGKALNDPIAGITALKRVGVSFTASQMDVIKALVETGDTLGAQKLILQELSTEFGGQAAAAANTYTGQIAQLKNELGNLAEAFGNELLPDLIEVTGEIKDATITVTENWNEIKTWAYWITHIANPLLFLSDAIRNSNDNMDDHTDAIEDNQEALTELYGERKNYTSAEVAAARSITTLTEATWNFSDSSMEAGYAAAAQGLAIRGMIPEIEATEEALATLYDDEILDTIISQKDATQEYADTVGSLNEQLADGTITAEEHAAGMTEAADVYEEAGNKIIFTLVNMALAADGWQASDTAAMLSAGVSLGQFDQAQADMAASTISNAQLIAESHAKMAGKLADPLAVEALQAIDQALLEGKLDTIAYKFEVDQLKKRLNDLNGLEVYADVYITTHGSVPTFGNNPNATYSMGGGACFTGETLISLSDGIKKPILLVEVGDSVYSWNGEKQVVTIVSQVIKHEPQKRDIVIINGGLYVTPEHPLYIGGQWVKAGFVEVGDYLQNEQGEPVEITSVEWSVTSEAVYNLHIDSDEHNYFANGFLVHNKLADGGPIAAFGSSSVVERGNPELLTVGNQSWLMMGNKGGQVTALDKAATAKTGGGGGSSGMSSSQMRQLAKMIGSEISVRMG